MSDVTVVSAATGSNSGGVSATVPAPATLIAGNLLVAAMQCSNFSAQTFTLPSGWTQIQALNGGNPAGSMVLAQKYVGGSEPGSYAFSVSAGTPGLAAGIVQLAFVASSTPIDDHGMSAVSSGTVSFPAPSVTATAGNDLLVCAFGTVDGRTVSAVPSGMTSVARVILGANVGIDICVQTLSSSGATGTPTETLDSADTGIAASLLVLQGASGGLPVVPKIAAPIHARRMQAVMRASVI